MSTTTSFKIDSPYAKIGLGGQITCTLCNAIVKSSKVWIAHVNGRQHRENLAAKSSKKPQQSTIAQKPPVRIDQANLKRPAPPTNGNSANDLSKRAKVAPTDQIARTSTKSSNQPAQTKSLVSAASSDSESESDEIDEKPDVKPKVSSVDLTADFFDSGASSSTTGKSQQPAADEDEEMPDATPKSLDDSRKSGELPEGFFDDRKVDAKIRGVELKDPLDDEWSKFQREMQKVDVASEQIVEEDEDQTTLARDLDEAEEQMREWSRVNKLEKRKDAIIIPAPFDQSQATTSNQTNDDGMEEDDDDINLENVLDWRAKDVWK